MSWRTRMGGIVRILATLVALAGAAHGQESEPSTLTSGPVPQ